MIVNIAVLPQLRMAIWANLISSCGTEERASAGALNHPTRICMVMLAATSPCKGEELSLIIPIKLSVHLVASYFEAQMKFSVFRNEPLSTILISLLPCLG